MNDKEIFAELLKKPIDEIYKPEGIGTLGEKYLHALLKKFCALELMPEASEPMMLAAVVIRRGTAETILCPSPITSCPPIERIFCAFAAMPFPIETTIFAAPVTSWGRPVTSP